MVSTVSASTSKLEARHRSIMLFVRPRSLWKYNWKSFGVLMAEPISSTLTVPRDEMPNMVPNFSAALATATDGSLSPDSCRFGRMPRMAELGHKLNSCYSDSSFHDCTHEIKRSFISNSTTSICGVIVQCGIEIDGELSAASSKYCRNLSVKIENLPPVKII